MMIGETDFYAGVTTCGFLVIAAFFFRFWARTRDILFFVFTAAFILMAVGQAAPALFDIAADDRPQIYLFRAAAFILIIVAVFVKNLPSRGGRG